MKFAVITIMALFNLSVFAETVPEINFAPSDGSYVNGREFSTKDFKGKITALFYVDPDHRTINDEANEKLQQQAFDLKYYQSFAIINMKATWLPNAILDQALKNSQKNFPDTKYVRDLNKVLVQKMNLKDDGYQTMLLNEKCEVIFNHIGKLTSTQVDELIKIIKKEINKLAY